jgi:hypothetical protein
MRRTDFTAKLADGAPSASTLTDYDEEHLLTYRGLLDAEGDGAEWDEATLLVLCIDAVREPARAHRAWEGHLARAKWRKAKADLDLVTRALEWMGEDL